MYARVRTDNMSGTQVGKDLVSAKYFVESDPKDIENGSLVAIGALLEGEREIRKATAPKKDTAIFDLALVATPEVIKDKTYYSLGDFINKAGNPIRCYRLTPGSTFAVTKEVLDGQPTVDYFVEAADDSTKFKVVESNTEGSTLVGKILAIEGDYTVIEVARQ